MNHDVLVIHLRSPLVSGGGVASQSAEILDEDDLITLVERHVDAGHEAVMVDLSQLETASEPEVKDLTSFLWSLRVAGAAPVVVCPVARVASACRSLKLDLAFPFFV